MTTFVASGCDSSQVQCSRPSDRYSSALQVTVSQGGIELIERISSEWENLSDRSRPELSFLRPALVSAYFNSFVPSAQIVLLVARRHGEMVAVLPLVERTLGFGLFRVHWLESAGNVHLPRFDALYGDEDPDVIAEAFWAAIRKRPRWIAIQMAVAPLDGVINRMRKLAASDGWPTGIFNAGESPYIAVPGPIAAVDDLIVAQGSGLRRSLRHGRRRLAEQGQLRSVVARQSGPEGDIAEWLERFCELEDAGWKGEAGTSIRCHSSTRAFYSALARDPALRRHLVCFSVLLDDVLVSSGLGLIDGTTYFGLKLAINEKFRSCAPGHLLVLYRTLAMSQLGCTEIDLGGRADPYKLSWTSTARPFGYIFVFRKGVRGRLLQRLAVFVEGPGKKMLKRGKLRSVVRRVRR